MITIADRGPPNMDEQLARLARVPPDRSLASLEPLVWARIAAKRSNGARSASWRWRASIAAAALAIGIAAGGAAAARPGNEFALFSAHAELAPSTLLGFAE